jgi:hypothetical protein
MLYNVLLLKHCAKYCLDPEPEPEPEHPEQEPEPKLFQSRNWNKNAKNHNGSTILKNVGNPADTAMKLYFFA